MGVDFVHLCVCTNWTILSPVIGDASLRIGDASLGIGDASLATDLSIQYPVVCS